MKVKSDDRTIGEVLQGHFLKVPRFQRPYEWTKEEVDDFWDDIHGASLDFSWGLGWAGSGAGLCCPAVVLGGGRG